MGQGAVTIVVDLGFGDAGKGTVVDYLSHVSPVATVVRYNGGGQAAHNVVLPDGTHHTFAQFGSGTFVPGVKTHLSHHMLVSLDTLIAEADHLWSLGIRDAMSRLTIDRDAKLVTRFQRAANRIRERSRGLHRHGSCGMGIGETMMLANDNPALLLTVGAVHDRSSLQVRLCALQEHYRETLRELCAQLRTDAFVADDIAFLMGTRSAEMQADFLHAVCKQIRLVDRSHLQIILAEGDTVFEGAQGVLLDERHGFHPYTTWSTTTNANALSLLREASFNGHATTLGVLRAFHTRHGAGPFVTEDANLHRLLREEHNTHGAWQGAFRIGWFDLVMARYALQVTPGVDALALTHLDWLHSVRTLQLCSGYTYQSGARAQSLALQNVDEKGVFPESCTRELLTAQPMYELLPHTMSSKKEAEYVARLESELRIPISLLSDGPTWKDKSRRRIA